MPITTKGNTVLPPPRLSGNAEMDARAMQRWLTDLFEAVVLVSNVTGAIADHETRIAALEKKVGI